MSPSPASPNMTAHRRRRLTPAEMAQIAGRAGRHQRDGTFGSLTLEGDALAEFRPEEIEAIEEHRFAPLDFLYWRESELDFGSVEALIRSLERRPVAPEPSRRARGDRPRRAPDPRRRSGGPCAGGRARNGPAALGGLRPARFPQDRARASCPAGRAHLPPSERGRRPNPAGLVCRAGRPARQCPGRYRHARRPDRRGAHLGLYRPPRRLAGRSGDDGRAHHGGRGEALRRAARAAHPALRRPAHLGADARPRQEGRRRVPGADRRGGRGQRRLLRDRAAAGLRLRGRSGRAPRRPQDAARHRRAAARRRI